MSACAWARTAIPASTCGTRIRRDQEELAKRRLRELMEEGLNSGPAHKMTPADWAGLRKAALGRKG